MWASVSLIGVYPTGLFTSSAGLKLAASPSHCCTGCSFILHSGHHYSRRCLTRGHFAHLLLLTESCFTYLTLLSPCRRSGGLNSAAQLSPKLRLDFIIIIIITSFCIVLSVCVRCVCACMVCVFVCLCQAKLLRIEGRG